MAKVDFWVLVSAEAPDFKIARPVGPKRTEDPVDIDPGPHNYWIQLDSNDPLYTKMTWDFETGPMPKELRGLGLDNFRYDLETKTWTNDPPYVMSWQEVRDARQGMLLSTDWIVAKYTELGQPLPAEWVEWRQALRDWPETHSNLEPEEAMNLLNLYISPETRKRRLALGLSEYPDPNNPDPPISLVNV